MVDIDDLAQKPAAEIARVLADRRADPVGLTEHYLEKIGRQTSPIFLTVTADRARREAEAAARRLKAGRPASALDGVPMAWKDLVDFRGETTTAASNIYRNALAAESDAPILANAARAGMIALGKVNLSEFAYSGLGLNPHFGTPLNPNDTVTPRAPGGSSSGSGVAVAAGLAPCAIGTDTGGSVRIPAAFNGVVGYKSSEGRIPARGVFALSRTLDTVGPLARTVEDCILLDMVLRGAVTSGVTRRPVETLRIFVPETVVLDDLDPAVSENFEKSLALLEQAGAVVTRGPLPQFAEAARLAAELGSITAAEAYVEHRDLVDGPGAANIDRRVLARIQGGKAMSAADLIVLHRARLEGMAAISGLLDGALLAMPTAPHVAPAIAPLEADDALFHRINLKTLRNTVIGNFFNLPGVALPNGTDGGGLPTSFLLCTVGNDDERLLGAALDVERVLRTAG
ncbi:amidase [Labrenzia aggregata]|uniref:Indoleacetamide hydrolase n=2 Tax=Roseibium aggregatum TaxID=187304 RepID=A0A939EL94_9HYPH|nr:amidase [Roseibium aggregatum]